MNNDSDFLIVNSTEPHNEFIGYNTLETPRRSNERNRLPQYIATISAAISAIAAGAALGWTAPIVAEIEKGNFNNISVNDKELGWIGSFIPLGAAASCIPTGFITDLIGPKLTLLSLFLPYTLGWGLIYWATNLLMVYFGRFILGISVGVCCVAAPMYISEIAQKEIRGTLGSYFQLMITIGILYAYLFGAVLPVGNYIIACSAIPFVFVICFAFQPESPLFYMKKSKFDAARISLMRLRGTNLNLDEELAEIEKTLKGGDERIGFFKTLARRASKKAVFISLSLMLFQQMSGINAIIFYTSDIFEAAGNSLNPKYATIIIGFVQVIATFISSLFVDKLGRRVLLIASAFFMSVSIITLGSFFLLKERELIPDDVARSLSFLAILSLLTYITVFSLGFGPIPWMISGEIFAPEIKSIASAVAGAFNWLLAFFITKYYIEVEKVVGESNSFIFFGMFLLFSTAFVYFVVPETKGKSISEIQSILEQ